MNNKQLIEILSNIYKFSEGLNKKIFMWDKLPKNVKILAGTDNSGIVKWNHKEYYVYYEWLTKTVQIEDN